MDKKIEAVTFLMPARIDYTEGSVNVNVDMVNRRVFNLYGLRWEPEAEDNFFNFLDESVKLPESIFAAPSDVIEEGIQMRTEHDAMKKSPSLSEETNG